MTEDLASLRKQLAEAETNLRLLRERKAQYVQETDVPLQLIKEERRLESERERILGLMADLEPHAAGAGAAGPPVSGAKRVGAQYLKEHQAVVVAVLGLIGVVLAAVIGILPELIDRQEPTPAASTPVVQAAPTHTATPTASSVAGPSSTVPPAEGGAPAGNTPIAAPTQTATPTPVLPDATPLASTPTAAPTTPPPPEATPTSTPAPPTATPTATVTPTATDAPEIENLLSDILGDLSHAYEAALPDLEANWHPLLDEYFCGSRADRKRENWRKWLINTFGVKIRAINPYSELWIVQSIDNTWRVRRVETWCYENLTPQGTQLRVKQEQHLYTYYFQPNQQSDDPSFCIYDYETSARYYAYEGDERLLCGR